MLRGSDLGIEHNSTPFQEDLTKYGLAMQNCSFTGGSGTPRITPCDLIENGERLTKIREGTGARKMLVLK